MKGSIFDQVQLDVFVSDSFCWADEQGTKVVSTRMSRCLMIVDGVSHESREKFQVILPCFTFITIFSWFYDVWRFFSLWNEVHHGAYLGRPALSSLPRRKVSAVSSLDFGGLALPGAVERIFESGQEERDPKEVKEEGGWLLQAVLWKEAARKTWSKKNANRWCWSWRVLFDHSRYLLLAVLCDLLKSWFLEVKSFAVNPDELSALLEGDD